MSASAITERVLVDVIQSEQPVTAMPTVKSIAKAANRKRQQLRPHEPTDIFFDLDQTQIAPHFVKVSLHLRMP